MLVVSTREFRDNQKSYLDKIDLGIEMLLQRGRTKAYKIIPVSDDDALISKEAFYAKLNQAEQSIKDGKGNTVYSQEELITYLDSL
jgi:hypothetical protein